MKTCIIFLSLIVDLIHVLSVSVLPQANPTDMPLSSRDLVHKGDKMRPYVQKLNSIKLLPSEYKTVSSSGADLLVENERIHIPLNRNGLDQVKKIHLDKDKLKRYLDILELESATKPITIQLDESKVMDYLKMLNDMSRYPENLVYKSRIKSMKGSSPIMALTDKEKMLNEISRDVHFIEGNETPLVLNRFGPRVEGLKGKGNKMPLKEFYNEGKNNVERSVLCAGDIDDKAYIQMENDYGEIVNDRPLYKGEIVNVGLLSNENYEDMQASIDGEEEKKEEIMGNYFIGNDNQVVSSPLKEGVSLLTENNAAKASGIGSQKSNAQNTFSSREENERYKAKMNIEGKIDETNIDKASNSNTKFNKIRETGSCVTNNSFYLDNIDEANKGSKILPFSTESKSKLQPTNLTFQVQVSSQTGERIKKAEIQDQDIQDKTNIGQLLTSYNNNKNLQTPSGLESYPALNENKAINEINDSQPTTKIINKGTDDLSSKISSPEILSQQKTTINSDSAMKEQIQKLDNQQLPANYKNNELRTESSEENLMKSNTTVPKLISEKSFMSNNDSSNLKSSNKTDFSFGFIRNGAYEPIMNQNSSIAASTVNNMQFQKIMNNLKIKETPKLLRSNFNSTNIDSNQNLSNANDFVAGSNLSRVEIHLFESSTAALSSSNTKPIQLLHSSAVKDPKNIFYSVTTSKYNPSPSDKYNWKGTTEKPPHELISMEITGNSNKYKNTEKEKEKVFTLHTKIASSYHVSPIDSNSKSKSSEDTKSSEDVNQGNQLKKIASTENDQALSKKASNSLNSPEDMPISPHSALQNSLWPEIKDNSGNKNLSSLNELKPTNEYPTKSLISSFSNHVSKALNEKATGDSQFGLEGSIPVKSNNTESSKMVVHHEFNNNLAGIKHQEEITLRNVHGNLVTRKDEELVCHNVISATEKSELQYRSSNENTNQLPKEKKISIVGNEKASLNLIDQQRSPKTNVTSENIELVTIPIDDNHSNIENNPDLFLPNRFISFTGINTTCSNLNPVLFEYSQPNNITNMPQAPNRLLVTDKESKSQEFTSIQNLENTKNKFVKECETDWSSNSTKHNFKSYSPASVEELMSASMKQEIVSDVINKSVLNYNNSKETVNEISPVHLVEKMNSVLSTSDGSSILSKNYYPVSDSKVNIYRPTKPPFMYDQYYERIINQLKNAKAESTIREGTNEKEILTILNNNLAHIHVDKGALYKIIGKALTPVGGKSYLEKPLGEQYDLTGQTSQEEKKIIEPQQHLFRENPTNAEPIYPRAMVKWREKNHYFKRRSINEPNAETSSGSYKNLVKQESIEKTQDVNILFPSNR